MIISRFGVAIISVIVASSAMAEQIQSAQIPYLVKYSDGTAEKFVAVYAGLMDVSKNESGRPSTWNHPIDDRTCHWNINSYIKRDLCLVSRTGQRFCEGKDSTVWNVSTQNQGSSFKIENLASENCGQAQGRFESDVANARNTVNANFSKILSADGQVVNSILRQRGGSSIERTREQ